jgi:hypothetical protein
VVAVGTPVPEQLHYLDLVTGLGGHRGLNQLIFETLGRIGCVGTRDGTDEQQQDQVLE